MPSTAHGAVLQLGESGGHPGLPGSSAPNALAVEILHDLDGLACHAEMGAEKCSANGRLPGRSRGMKEGRWMQLKHSQSECGR